MQKFKALSARLKRTDAGLPPGSTTVGQATPCSQHQSETKSSAPSSPDPMSTTPFPDGVEVLYDHPEAEFDICFVHGLTGNRRTTWTPDQQSAPWPQTLLPSQISRTRILTYGYDAYFIQKSVSSSNRLIDHATNLMHDLVANRATCNASGRPLIFVAHSLGGLVCKKSILLSRNSPERHLQDIYNSMTGIIFMGTPHKGSWMADWTRIPASSLGFIKSTNKSLLAILETDDQMLESLQIDFLAMLRQLREYGRYLEVTCFYEELPLPVVGTVVGKESATLDGYSAISIHANHRNMVKMGYPEDNGFKRLLGELRRWKSQLKYVPVVPKARPTMNKTLMNKFINRPEPSDSISSSEKSQARLSSVEKVSNYTFHNFGRGWINANSGPGSQNNNNGAGNQFNGSIQSLVLSSGPSST